MKHFIYTVPSENVKEMMTKNSKVKMLPLLHFTDGALRRSNVTMIIMFEDLYFCVTRT